MDFSDCVIINYLDDRLSKELRKTLSFLHENLVSF